MSARIRNRLLDKQLGYSTLVISIATLLAALSIFLASAIDVGATSMPSEADAAAPATPIVIPREWAWHGREPVSLEFMYAKQPQPQGDWIRMDHAQ